DTARSCISLRFIQSNECSLRRGSRWQMLRELGRQLRDDCVPVCSVECSASLDITIEHRVLVVTETGEHVAILWRCRRCHRLFRRSSLYPLLLHDESSGDNVAKPLARAVRECDDDRDEIDPERIDHPQQIPHCRRAERDREPTIANDAQLHDALSWSLAVPDPLEYHVVTPHDHELRDEVECE